MTWMSTDYEPDFYYRKYRALGAVVIFLSGLLRWSAEKFRRLSEGSLAKWQS